MSQSAAFTFLIESQINDGTPLNQMFENEAFTHPEKYLDADKIEPLRKLFIEKRINDYHQLTPEEKVIFWSKGFSHSLLFTNLYVAERWEKPLSEKNYERAWGAIFLSIIEKTEKTFQQSIFSIICQQYDNSGDFAATMINAFVKKYEDEKYKKFISDNKDKLQPFIGTIIAMAESYMKSDPEKAWSYCMQCKSHPILINTYLKENIHSTSITIDFILTAINQLDAFAVKFGKILPVTQEQYKETIKATALLFEKITAKHEFKIFILDKIKKLLVTLYENNTLVSIIHWQFYPPVISTRYPDDIFKYFIDELFGEPGSKKRTQSVDAFLELLDKTNKNYPEHLVTMATHTNITTQLHAWTDTVPPEKVIALAIKHRTKEQPNPFCLFTKVTEKESWKNLSPSKMLDYVKQARSKVLMDSYQALIPQDKWDWNVWLAANCNTLPF